MSDDASWTRFLNDVTPDWLKNKAEPKVTPVDVSDCPLLTATVIGYLDSLGSTQVSGTKIAALFDLTINKGETLEGAIKSLDLPPCPAYMRQEE